MKILDRIALAVFSVMMILISLFVCATIFGWLDTTQIYLISMHILSDRTICNILIVVNVIFLLLAIKGLFFESISKEDSYNGGIQLENDDGKLLITQETIIGIVDAVVADFVSVKGSQAKVNIDSENNLSIIVTVETTSDTIIKDLSNNLQIKIKEKIKESLDVDVKSIDIRVKDIVESKSKITKE